MNSGSAPLRRTRRGEIDPVDTKNDEDSLDYDFTSKSLQFPSIRSLREGEPYGGLLVSKSPADRLYCCAKTSK